MSHILRTSTEHVTTPLADEGNYAYCALNRHLSSFEVKDVKFQPQQFQHQRTHLFTFLNKYTML